MAHTSIANQNNFTEYKQQVITDFNRRTHYDEGNTFHPFISHDLVDLASLQPGQTVLDIATGTGFAAFLAAQIVAGEGRVLGVDFSSGMLEQANRKKAALGLKQVEFLEADVDQLSLPNEHFDAVLCASAIFYLTDIPAALRSWYRCLKSGGRLAFSCSAENAFESTVLFRQKAQTYGIPIPNPNEPLGTPKKCHKMMQQAGFTTIEVITKTIDEYLSIQNLEIDQLAERAWNGNVNSAFGYQVLQLSSVQLQQCKSEYIAELKALAMERMTSQGIWIGGTTFFVLGRK